MILYEHSTKIYDIIVLLAVSIGTIIIWNIYEFNVKSREIAFFF